jgi:phosphoglycolate phosphatase
MRAVVFDLDGTLIDTAPDLAAVLNHMLAAEGRAAVSLHEVRGMMIGDGAKHLLKRAFAARGVRAEPRHLVQFIIAYHENPVREAICYPGVEEALTTLKKQGRQLGLCTNKPIAPTIRILDELGLTPYFTAIIGGDSTPYKKPDPRHLAATLAGMDVASAIMVGDHPNDLAAAAGLGQDAIFVSWGYGVANATHVADTAQELLLRIAEMG